MSNTKLLLQRQSVIGQDYAQMIKDLSEKTVSTLGYKPLKQRYEQFETLLKLNEVGAMPYTNESVQKYKDQIIKDNSSIYISDNSSIISDCAILAWAMFGVVFLVSILYYALTWFLGWPWPGWMTYVAIISFLYLAGYLVLGDENKKDKAGQRIEKREIVYQWVEIPISSYERAIPMDILSMALSIKNIMPNAQIFVDQLQIRKEPLRDPFLVVRLGSDRFYVAVWDEPKFET